MIICAAGAVDHDWLVEQIAQDVRRLEGTTPPAGSRSRSAKPALSDPSASSSRCRWSSACPACADRRAALRRLRPEHRARRRHELAPLPGGAREARQGLLDLVVPRRPSARRLPGGERGPRRRLGGRGDRGRPRRAPEARARRPRGEELARAKSQIKGTILLSLESSESRMSRIAKNEMYFGHNIEPVAVAEAISEVTHDDVVAVARELFSRPHGRRAARRRRRQDRRVAALPA